MSTSCRHGLVVANSLNFLLYFWRTVLLRIEFLVDIFFFLHIEYFGLLPLTSKVYKEKSADKLIEDPLHVTNHFSLSVVKIQSFKSLITMYVEVGLFEFIWLRVCWASCVFKFMSSPIWEIFSQYFIKYSLCCFLSCLLLRLQCMCCFILTEFFILIIVLLSSRTFLFYFKVPISLWIFSFYIYITYFTFFTYFLNSLSIFNTVILKSLSRKK